MKEKTLCIRVFGIVQGVGFRPTVSRHAMASVIWDLMWRSGHRDRRKRCLCFVRISGSGRRSAR